MKTSALIIAVLLVTFVDCHQLETLTNDPNVTHSIGISGRVLIQTGLACPTNGALFCGDDNRCRTGVGAARAPRVRCTQGLLVAAVAGDQYVCPANQYCYEPNPATPGSARCTAVLPVGCNSILANQCTGSLADAGKMFCYNSSPCVQENSIITCTATGAAPANDLGGVGGGLSCNNAAQGLVGCQDNVGGQPKCIKQVPWYCPNAVPFLCTGFGFYPNVYNCQQYFQCIAPGSVGLAKQCPNGQVFDPMANNNGNQCKVSNGVNSCVEGQCGAGAGSILLPYPGFSKSYGSYAVVCGGPQPAVYRCEDGFVPDLNTFPITCTGPCPGSNRRAVDPANPNGYYSCASNGGKYAGAQRLCPNALIGGVLVSEVYNSDRKQCVAVAVAG